MHFSHRLFLLLAFLDPLFRPSTGAESSELVGHNTNQTHCPLIPTDDLVGQILSMLNCGPFPLSPNSHLQYSLDHDTKDLKVFQTCDRYFKTTKTPESLQVECRRKKWISKEIGCEKTTCPRLAAPPGGQISSNNTAYNSTVYFWCSRGFSINGTDKLFCEESGVWNFPPPTCDVSYCRPLSSPRHGFVSSQKETATNQTVEFSCEREYTLFGDAILRCQDDGRWNTSAPVCQSMCTVPNVENQSGGVHTVPGLRRHSNGSLLQHGQRVIFSCKPGYAVSSPELSTCIGGTWRPPIHCRKLCAVFEIANGTYTLSNDSSSIEYSCLPGYQLIGQQKLSCTPNLKWDNETPACAKACVLSEEIKVLSFRQKETYEIIPFGTQIRNGTQVYYTCRPDSPQQPSITECVNGELNPYTCREQRSRLESTGFLEVFDNQTWKKICHFHDDTCAVFGYDRGSSDLCQECYDLEMNTYQKTLRIILHERKKSPTNRHSKPKCTWCH